MNVLEVTGLDVHRGEAHVLHGVSFAVPEKGVTALLGRNGAGKTTTLLAVLGLLPRRGGIALAGEPIAGLRTHRIVQRGVGYVPEDREVFAHLSVAENLRLAMRTPQARERLERVHELFPDLQQRAGQRAGTLSGGQQQMVAVARALLNPNRLLLVDEPSKGLAPALVDDVAATLQRAAEETTILLVEQNLAVAGRLAERAVVLEAGRVAFEGSTQALFDDPEMTERHLGVRAGPGTGVGDKPE